MACHIPFVYSAKDCRYVSSIYRDSEIVRISLQSASNLLSLCPDNAQLWVDAGVDVIERWPNVSTNWSNFIKGFTGWQSITDKTFQQKPDAMVVSNFIGELLDQCLNIVPSAAWLSVPQLPVTRTTSRSRINRMMAEAAASWRRAKKYKGKFILPIIVTHQQHTNRKTDRNQRVKLALQSFTASEADGYWVVDSSLSDQSGAGTFARLRFPGLINFHIELAAALSTDGPSIGGPYWALNLVLWARGLITYPAIGLGVGYQYYTPGGPLMPAKARIALPPLRRLATVSPNLEQWLKNLPKADPALEKLRRFVPQFHRFYMADGPRQQVAHFYKAWFDNIANTPVPGRALALYQDFSTAYVLGKSLPDLPAEEQTARRPERIAEQFMLQCL